MPEPPPPPKSDEPAGPSAEPGAPEPAASQDPDLRDRAEAAGKAALQAIGLFVANPVGDLGRAFETLGPRRALGAGLAMGAVAVIGTVVGLVLLHSRPGIGGLLADLLRMVILALVAFAVLVGMSLAARTLLGGKGSFEGDVFVAGATQLPMGVWIFVAGLVGRANFEVILLGAVFAFCYATFILFGGCTKVSQISEAAATLAVPAILVLSSWLASVAARAVL